MIAALALLGCYYAATDGVLAAMGSATLPAPLVGSGLALLATATNVARLLASVLFGVIWQWTGITTAIVVFGVGLLVSVIAAQTALAPGRSPTRQPCRRKRCCSVSAVPIVRLA